MLLVWEWNAGEQGPRGHGANLWKSRMGTAGHTMILSAGADTLHTWLGSRIAAIRREGAHRISVKPLYSTLTVTLWHGNIVACATDLASVLPHGSHGKQIRLTGAFRQAAWRRNLHVNAPDWIQSDAEWT